MQDVLHQSQLPSQKCISPIFKFIFSLQILKDEKQLEATWNLLIHELFFVCLYSLKLELSPKSGLEVTTPTFNPIIIFIFLCSFYKFFITSYFTARSAFTLYHTVTLLFLKFSISLRLSHSSELCHQKRTKKKKKDNPSAHTVDIIRTGKKQREQGNIDQRFLQCKINSRKNKSNLDTQSDKAQTNSELRKQKTVLNRD